MKVVTKRDCRVIKESDPQFFQEKYIKLMEEFQGDVDVNVAYSDGFFVAIATRTTKEVLEDRTIADEFHDEGIRYVCSQCPYLEIDGDKRKKRHPCKYSEFGTSRIDSECCEMFYKLLKQGKIVPR